MPGFPYSGAKNESAHPSRRIASWTDGRIGCGRAARPLPLGPLEQRSLLGARHVEEQHRVVVRGAGRSLVGDEALAVATTAVRAASSMWW